MSSFFESPNSQIVRRSIRVAQMTPSKINLGEDSDSSEATVRPLKLLGSAGRSPTRSRGRTPGKKTQPTTGIISAPRNYMPFRMDQVPAEVGTLLDSRLKQSKRLAAFEDTPSKDWPSEPLVTPAMQQNHRKVSSPDFDEAATAKPASRTREELPLPVLPGQKGTIFLQRPLPQRRTRKIIPEWGWKAIANVAILILGFLTALLYKGEIIDALIHFKSSKLDPVFRREGSSNTTILSNDLEALFSDLKVLRNDVSRLPIFDPSALIERIDKIEAQDSTSDTQLQSLRQRLVEIQSRIDELASWRSVEALSHQVSSTSTRVAALEVGLSEAISTQEKQGQHIGELGTMIRQLPTPESILNDALHRFEQALPERLLVRSTPSGDVHIDAKLLSRLQLLLRPAGNSEAKADLSREVEEYLRGRIDDLDKRLVGKHEILSIVKEHLEAEIQPLLQQGKPDPLDMTQLTEDVLAKISTKLDRATPPQAPSNENPYGPNLASESAGARPIIALSSPSYTGHEDQFWSKWATWIFPSKPHRLALSSDNSFGNCWAFPGTSGHLTFQLASSIVPKYLRVCHLGKNQVDDRSSSPARVELYAITSITDPASTILLGEFSYELEGPSCQYFKLTQSMSSPARFFKLRVTRNHGKDAFTCLYQLGLFV